MREVTVLGRRLLYHTRDEWLDNPTPQPFNTPPASPGDVEAAMCHYPGAKATWVAPLNTAAWIRFGNALYLSDPNRGYPYGYSFQIGYNPVDWSRNPVELDLWEVRGFDRRNAANNGDFPPFSTTKSPWNQRTYSAQIMCSEIGSPPHEDQLLTFQYFVAMCDDFTQRTVDVYGHWQTDFTACPGPLRPFVLSGAAATRPDFWVPGGPNPEEDKVLVIGKYQDKFYVGDGVWRRQLRGPGDTTDVIQLFGAKDRKTGGVLSDHTGVGNITEEQLRDLGRE